MDFTTSAEVWLVCCSVLFGMAAMLLYDLFCIWRLAVPAGRSALFIQDLLYWMLLSIACILFLFVTNRGQPRLFILLAALAGPGATGSRWGGWCCRWPLCWRAGCAAPSLRCCACWAHRCVSGAVSGDPNGAFGPCAIAKK